MVSGLLPPNKDDKKFCFGAGAGAGVDVGVNETGDMVEETLGFVFTTGLERGMLARVDTLMDGLKLNSLLSFLLKMSDKSVVSFKNEGFEEVGFVLVIENNGDVALALDGDVGSEDVPFDAETFVDSEKGSDFVFVGSTNKDKSSIGTTLSGGVPPMFDVLSCVISILFNVVEPLAVGEALPDLLIFTVFNSLLVLSDDLSNVISLIPFIVCILSNVPFPDVYIITS